MLSVMDKFMLLAKWIVKLEAANGSECEKLAAPSTV